MLAAKAADAGRLRFPLLASPKLDGMRVTITEKGPLTRSGALLPNERVRAYLAPLIGFDGELTFGDPVAPDVVQRSIAAGMSRKGPAPEAGLVFWVFDHFLHPEQPYIVRCRLAELMVKKANLPHVEIVPQNQIDSQEELDEIEERYIGLGFEGVVLRRLDGPYVFGRTEAHTQILLKLKRREHMSGQIVGVARKDGGSLALLILHPDYAAPFDVPVYGKEAATLSKFDQSHLVGRTARFTRLRGSWKRAPRSPLFVGLIELKTREEVRYSKETPMPRELIDTGTDKRYVRRDKKGEFKSSVDVGRSLSADRRKKAKTVPKKGDGDRGDERPSKKAAKKRR